MFYFFLVEQKSYWCHSVCMKVRTSQHWPLSRIPYFKRCWIPVFELLDAPHSWEAWLYDSFIESYRRVYSPGTPSLVGSLEEGTNLLPSNQDTSNVMSKLFTLFLIVMRFWVIRRLSKYISRYLACCACGNSELFSVTIEQLPYLKLNVTWIDLDLSCHLFSSFWISFTWFYKFSEAVTTSSYHRITTVNYLP